MRAWLTAKFQNAPRLPLLGVAIAAVTGILAAELWRLHFIRTSADARAAQWIVLIEFALFLGVWVWRQRAAWFLLTVAAGYASLHLFATDPVSALTLARVLDSPSSAVATGSNPTRAKVHVVHATGTVVDTPRAVPPPADLPVRQEGPTWRFNLRLDHVEVDGLRWPCEAMVAATWRDAVRTLSAGDALELTALAENLQLPRNPGEPDQAARLRRQGILSTVRISGITDGRVLPSATGPGRWFSLASLRRVAGHVHAWMERTLSLDLGDDPEARAVISTALLGLSSPPGLGDLENVFQRTGTLHYFAIDGLKLGLVAYLLLQALRWLGIRRPWTGLLVLPLVLGYAFATGLGAASVRAVVVAAVLVGGEFVDRPARPLNSLGLAAAFLLLLNPPSLFDLGFQLTFSVMLAILLLVRPLAALLARSGAPDPFLPPLLYPPILRAREAVRIHTCELTAVSVAAWVGSLPLMCVTFHLFSPVSLVANVVTFPVAFTVLALGVLSLATSSVSAMAIWFNNANWVAAKSFLWLVRLFDAVPGGSFAVPSVSHWYWPAPAAELVVYDFDRGRAASLRAGRAGWLFDAARPGEYASSVLPCLRAHAVERLTGGLLITQDDADHLAAARLAFTDLHPTRVVDSALSNRSPLLRDFRRFLAANQHLETLLHRDDTLPLGDGANANVLYPPDDLSGKFRSAADRALVLRVTIAGWHVLFLNEGNGAAAHWLPTHVSPTDLAGEILVTASPVSPELLAAVGPRLIILRPPIVKETPSGDPLPPVELPPIPDTVPTLVQRDSGAVVVLIHPDHLEATGFLDQRQVTLQK